MAKIKHSIYDTDTHFSVDVVTRELKNEGTPKNTLIVGDHNSERFTFQFPRYIEGHDMSKCDHVQVHFNNVDAATKAESRGVYEVDDLQISPDGEETVICSWLISGTATKYVGALGFLVRFSCVENDGRVYYVWNTAIYSKTMVSNGIYNGEAVVEEYADILAQWEAELKANQIVSLEQTIAGEEDGGTNVWTATFGDGRTSDFRVKNGSRGPTGLIGSIETIDGNPLHFFFGTQAEYEALNEEQKENLFAIITDDGMANDMAAAIAKVDAFVNGTTAVPKAATAGTATNAQKVLYGGSYVDPVKVVVEKANTAKYVENGGGLSVKHAETAGTATNADKVLYNGYYADPVKVVVEKAESDSAGNSLLYEHFHANVTFKGEIGSNTVTFGNITANGAISASYFFVYRESANGIRNFGIMRWVKDQTSRLRVVAEDGVTSGDVVDLTLSADGVLTASDNWTNNSGGNPKLVIQRICAS